MNKALWDKLAALGGVGFVVFFVVGMLLPGTPPAVDDSATEVASFFTDNRSAVLAGTFLIGIGVLSMLWFVGSLVHAIREAGESRLAVTALAAFVLAFTIGAIAALTRAGLAFSIAGLVEPTETLALFHMTVLMDTLGGILFAGFFFAVGGAAVRTNVLPSAWGWVTGLLGLLFAITATAWSRDGFWSPTGEWVIVVNLAFVIWVVVTSVLHYRSVSNTA